LGYGAHQGNLSVRIGVGISRVVWDIGNVSCHIFSLIDEVLVNKTVTEQKTVNLVSHPCSLYSQNQQINGAIIDSPSSVLSGETTVMHNSAWMGRPLRLVVTHSVK